jgi:outer membrane protein assembly factor BamB
MNRFQVSVASALFAICPAIAADALPWPQFRGPNGSGVADTQKPPVEFGPEKNLKWKVPVPSGASSPVIAGEKLFLTAFDGGKLYTLAYSTTDGKELWRTEAPAQKLEAFHKTEGSPAASTVTTDGKIVVSYFGSAGVFAYDVAGKQLWQYDLPPAQTAADFGTGVSPILIDGLVVLVRDELKEPKILALDAATGSRKWETKRQSPSSFCSPVVWDNAGVKEVVTAGYGRLIAYDLKSGSETWSVVGMPSACCASPIVADGLLYYAGWSPGDAEDKEFKMPSFDTLLESDADKDGKLSSAESEKTFLAGFFDNNDTNKDGFITREEWDATIKYMSAAKNSAFAVKPGGKGDVSKTHVVWKATKGLPYVPSGILYKGQLFLVKDGGLVTAYDAKTGKEIYAVERSAAQGRYYASPVAANGHIYTTTLDDGTFTVFKAGETSPEAVTKNPKLGERVFATPAIADNTLFVRSAKSLWAFQEKK